jgi:hypothetical protein
MGFSNTILHSFKIRKEPRPLRALEATGTIPTAEPYNSDSSLA